MIRPRINSGESKKMKEQKARELFELMCKQAQFRFDYPNIVAASWDEQSDRTRAWFRFIIKPLTGASA